MHSTFIRIFSGFRFYLCILTLSFCLNSSSSAVEKRNKEIILNLEDVRADFSLFPFRTGIPFPKGALKSPDNISLFSPDGKSIVADKKLVSSWDDGSVRWLLLNFQKDIYKGKDRENRIFLRYG